MKGGGAAAAGKKKVTAEAAKDLLPLPPPDSGAAVTADDAVAVDFDVDASGEGVNGGGGEPVAAPIVVEEGEKTVAEEDSEDEGGEDEKMEDATDDADAAVSENPLGTDFFDVEVIRRKRVHKGQTQYLIKWLNWPESANTWEPIENLANVSELVAAFDERWETSKHRKRRQKNTIHHSLLKKRQERSATPYSLRRLPATKPNNHTLPTPPNDLTYSSGSGSTYDIPAYPQPVIFADEVDNNGDTGSDGTAKHNDGSKSATPSEQVVKGNEENDYDPKLSELRAAATSLNDAGRLAIPFHETNLPSGNCHIDMEGQANGVGAEAAQSSRCRGAKKRKSGSVKRFNKDLYTDEPANAQNSVGVPNTTAEPRATGTVDKDGNYISKNTVEAKPPTIVKILRPINCTPIDPNIPRVVTFVVLRSDGTEMIVDNGYFKENQPLLLIEFYERHLRYSHAW